MSKKKEINKLINITAQALRHKIGSVVNSEDYYASKYLKEYESLMLAAKNVAISIKFNLDEKEYFEKELKNTLIKQLESKTFLKKEKFYHVDKEVKEAVKSLT